MTDQPTEKRVTWGELFFDLVYVFAITQTSELLHHDDSLPGVLRGLVLFIPLYWVWVGTSIQADLNDADRPRTRLLIFGVGLCGLFMALAIPGAFGHGEGGDRAVLFAVAFWVGRILLGLMMARGNLRRLSPVTWSMYVTGPLFVIGAVTHDWLRLAIWAVAALSDLTTPTTMRRRLASMHYDAAHMTERFGLFVLIALGESIVAAGAPAAMAEHLSAATLVAVGLAFALSTALWWVYFHFASSAMRFSMETAEQQTTILRHVLSYAHLSFIAAIVAVAVGMREAIGEPLHALGWPAAGYLVGGAALYLATFGYTRWTMFRLISSTRLVTAAVVLLTLPAVALLPALAGLGLLAVVVGTLNVVEYRRVAGIGFRAKLAARDNA